MKVSNVFKHGRTGTREHKLWIGIRTRCNNPRSKQFDRYGGRGIKLCARWENFENFLADMGPRPAGMSLERVDNDGDYEPNNCVWATPKTQANNRCNNRSITHDGRTMNLNEWAKEAKLTAPTLKRRLDKGWSMKEAITTPARKWSKTA